MISDFCLQIPEGTTDVKVGTLIGLLVGVDEDWKSVTIPAGAGQAEKSETTRASGGSGEYNIIFLIF